MNCFTYKGLFFVIVPDDMEYKHNLQDICVIKNNRGCLTSKDNLDLLINSLKEYFDIFGKNVRVQSKSKEILYFSID